jgi:polyisoprenoid-binding protein YceI
MDHSGVPTIELAERRLVAALRRPHEARGFERRPGVRHRVLRSVHTSADCKSIAVRQLELTVFGDGRLYTTSNQEVFMFLVRLPMSLVAASLISLATSSTAGAQTETSSVYQVNETAGTVGFTIYGSMIFKIKRDGQFKDFSGQLAYDPSNPAGTHVDLTVYTGSVDMHNPEQDQLMKSGDFFDVAHFPTMHFSSSSTDLKPDGTLAMMGDMTIRGITRHMTIPVRLRPAAKGGDSSGAVFETTFPIDRTEFGLNGSPKLGGFKLSISKNVEIHIAIATPLSPSQFAR